MIDEKRALHHAYETENCVQRLRHLNYRGRTPGDEITEMDIWIDRTHKAIDNTLRALGVPESSFEPWRREIHIE
jgi:hypothetical protein